MMVMQCPRCFAPHLYGKKCETPACQAFLCLPSYRRDLLEGNLYVAEAYVHEGNTEEDWVELVKLLTLELKVFDQDMALMCSTPALA